MLCGKRRLESGKRQEERRWSEGKPLGFRDRLELQEEPQGTVPPAQATGSPLPSTARLGRGEAAEGAEGSLGWVRDGHPRGDTRWTDGRDEAAGGKEA